MIYRIISANLSVLCLSYASFIKSDNIISDNILLKNNCRGRPAKLIFIFNFNTNESYFQSKLAYDTTLLEWFYFRECQYLHNYPCFKLVDTKNNYLNDFEHGLTLYSTDNCFYFTSAAADDI